jgi:hypothetical protein
MIHLNRLLIYLILIIIIILLFNKKLEITIAKQVLIFNKMINLNLKVNVSKQITLKAQYLIKHLKKLNQDKIQHLIAKRLSI